MIPAFGLGKIRVMNMFLGTGNIVPVSGRRINKPRPREEESEHRFAHSCNAGRDSALSPFPNKVIFTGSRDQDVDISSGRLLSNPLQAMTSEH